MPESFSESANSTIEQQLDSLIEAIEKTIHADALAFLGPINFGADDAMRDAIEAISPKREKLVVILQTPGGYIEVTQRIADMLRHHYHRVEFVIPNYAMSAGTVLAMSGDAIHMDYYSILGPIDPQVRHRDTGAMIPALGYLVQYERLIRKSKQGKLSTAELTFLIEKFNPAELYQYEQQRELSISLLKEWLVNYKFRNWQETETRKKPVTNAMRTRRASEIAKLLNNTDEWHSHGRGISMAVLRERLRLRIEDFRENDDLNKSIRAYYSLLTDYMMRRGHSAIVHCKKSYVALAW